VKVFPDSGKGTKYGKGKKDKKNKRKTDSETQ